MSTPINPPNTPCFESPLDEVTTQTWPEKEIVWINLIFKSAEEREFFISNESKLLSEEVQLSPLISDGRSSRSCLSVSCKFDVLKRVLGVLCSVFPNIEGLLEKESS
ncbi:MAG: hypothetical protein COT85_02015 [Chlamydiae bacterium CG10_big_fil_rev_8_21_14_0_10_42_34]|nr:MAG: hypothetical protein COT85_02015 [Chlamydiae bacterium CG10_big_fil_rev_8_21_14_0_10_42_34]